MECDDQTLHDFYVFARALVVTVGHLRQPLNYRFWYIFQRSMCVDRSSFEVARNPIATILASNHIADQIFVLVGRGNWQSRLGCNKGDHRQRHAFETTVIESSFSSKK